MSPSRPKTTDRLMPASWYTMRAQEIAMMSVSSATASVGSATTKIRVATPVRNWGRWGSDDEIGTLNFITPDAVAAACRLTTTGKVFALGIPLQREGPQS